MELSSLTSFSCNPLGSLILHLKVIAYLRGSPLLDFLLLDLIDCSVVLSPMAKDGDSSAAPSTWLSHYSFQIDPFKLLF